MSCVHHKCGSVEFMSAKLHNLSQTTKTIAQKSESGICATKKSLPAAFPQEEALFVKVHNRVFDLKVQSDPRVDDKVQGN